MTMNSNAESMLCVKDLMVRYETSDGIVEAVNNVNLEIASGETMGLIGETGAGKTTIALAIMGLLDIPPARIVHGSIRLQGRELTTMHDAQLRKIRGSEISMIFQDPMTALNPVLTVGEQIMEVIRIHDKCNRSEAMAKAIQMLETVGISSERAMDYPHQFSGGMKQRVVIAIALACSPRLLIADEPTTALDVTIQAQVLELMKKLKTDLGTSLLMITHDFGIVAEVCDKCAVLYAGEIVEYGSVSQIFHNALHPYTQGLFASIPDIEGDEKRLKPIPGLMSDPTKLPKNCTFCERCEKKILMCETDDPVLIEREPGHFVKCFLCGEEAGE